MGEVIQSFMSAPVHTIGVQETLAEAHELMNRFAIRHLPVLEGGKLVGMLSQRDLHLIETLRDVDPTIVTVEEAMNQDLLAVAPDEPLEQVAKQMAEHHYGSAMIVRERQLLGIFTSTDALRVLAGVVRTEQLAAEADASAGESAPPPG